MGLCTNCANIFQKTKQHTWTTHDVAQVCPLTRQHQGMRAVVQNRLAIWLSGKTVGLLSMI